MQSIYTAGISSYSMANLYQPAGVINTNSGYYNNNTNPNYMSQQQFPNAGGVLYAAPTTQNSSVAVGLSTNIGIGVTQLTDVNYSSQHINYEQNSTGNPLLNNQQQYATIVPK